MANAKELRKAFTDNYDTIIGRNKYSQNYREYVYTKYKDGNYYSDCSSSGCKTYDRIGLYTGSLNTAGMYYSSLFQHIDVDIVKGHVSTDDFSKLRVGDALMFVGNDSSRPLQIGHVEYIYSLGSTEASSKICGHGSGNPSIKNMKDYLTMRYNSTASSNGKRKQLVCVLRRIADDDTEPGSTSIEYKVATRDEGVTITASSLNIRTTPNGDKTGKAYKKGDVIHPTAKVFVNGDPWYKTKDGYCSGKYITGWIREVDCGNREWYVLAGYQYRTGFYIVGDDHYYFGDDGWLMTGWIKQGDLWMYADDTGILAVNEWIEDNGKKYWIDEAGYMCDDCICFIDGDFYHFNKDGTLSMEEVTLVPDDKGALHIK